MSRSDESAYEGLEGIYRSGMHVVPDLANRSVRVTVAFAQITLTQEQAGVLVGLLTGALEQFGIMDLELGDF